MVFVHSLQYCSSAAVSVNAAGGFAAGELRLLAGAEELLDADLRDMLAHNGPGRVSAAAIQRRTRRPGVSSSDYFTAMETQLL